MMSKCDYCVHCIEQMAFRETWMEPTEYDLICDFGRREFGDESGCSLFRGNGKEPIDE